jgi:hypothetical protein
MLDVIFYICQEVTTMKKGTLRARCTGKNWYTEDKINLGNAIYKILDADWCALTQFWYLKVERV